MFKEKLREYCRDPQSGSPDYGQWGALNREQRRFLRQCADYIEELERRIEQLEYERRTH